RPRTIPRRGPFGPHVVLASVPSIQTRCCFFGKDLSIRGKLSVSPREAFSPVWPDIKPFWRGEPFFDWKRSDSLAPGLAPGLILIGVVLIGRGHGHADGLQHVQDL